MSELTKQVRKGGVTSAAYEMLKLCRESERLQKERDQLAAAVKALYKATEYPSRRQSAVKYAARLDRTREGAMDLLRRIYGK